MITLEEAFSNSYQSNMADIVENFKWIMEQTEKDESKRCAPAALQRKMQVYRSLYDALQNFTLPQLEKWQFVEFGFTGDALVLTLCTAEEDSMEVEEEEEIVSRITYDVDRVLLRAEDWLTIEEFAALHDVSPVTVRLWISKGKLRYAKKHGRAWRIPSLQDKPPKEYGVVQYYLTDTIHIDGFPLVALSDEIILSQSRSKRYFDGVFSNTTTDMREIVPLTREEVEALEYALLFEEKAISEVYHSYMAHVWE